LLIRELVAFHKYRPPCRYAGVSASEGVFRQCLMSHGYNLYRPHMIPHLWSAFHRDKIEVTPAREYSVAIYLHVPDAPGLRQRVEAFCNGHFNADVVN